MKNTLGKRTKLKGKKNIQSLFQSGQSTRKGALRVVYRINEKGTNHQVGFTVSKRYFKNAPDRNRIKRLLREVYRLQQQDLNTGEDNYLHIMMIYQSHKMPDFDYLKKLTRNLIKELNKRVN